MQSSNRSVLEIHYHVAASNKLDAFAPHRYLYLKATVVIAGNGQESEDVKGKMLCLRNSFLQNAA